jgi:hypothetical protein
MSLHQQRTHAKEKFFLLYTVALFIGLQDRTNYLVHRLGWFPSKPATWQSSSKWSWVTRGTRANHPRLGDAELPM